MNDAEFLREVAEFFSGKGRPFSPFAEKWSKRLGQLADKVEKQNAESWLNEISWFSEDHFEIRKKDKSLSLCFIVGVKVWEGIGGSESPIHKLALFPSVPVNMLGFPASRISILEDIQIATKSAVRARFGIPHKWEINFLRQPGGQDFEWVQEEVSAVFGEQCKYEPRPTISLQANDIYKMMTVCEGEEGVSEPLVRDDSDKNNGFTYTPAEPKSFLAPRDTTCRHERIDSYLNMCVSCHATGKELQFVICPQDHHLKDGKCLRDYCSCRCQKCKKDCGEV